MCAEHFEDMMFANDLRNRLNPEAKPTLFSVPNPPPTVGTKRRVIEKVPAEAHHSRGKTLNIFLKIKYVTGFVRKYKKCHKFFYLLFAAKKSRVETTEDSMINGRKIFCVCPII